MRKFKKSILIVVTLAMAACSSSASPTPTATLPPPTQEAVATPSTPKSDPTETPLPTSTPLPRQLTICLGAEPDSLWLYGSNMLVKSTVMEAIYDGPIDPLSYDFQPVILEKLPSIADGDARVEQVAVEAGDWVVNDAGDPVQLQPGEIIRPYGCNTPQCTVEWDGVNLNMAQLSADFTLLEGIEWSDGVALTAHDSVFSYEIAIKCDDEWGYCGHNGLIRWFSSLDSSQRTASYQALDDLTIRWIGMPGFLDPSYQTNFFIPLPEHQLGDIPPQELFEAYESSQHPMGWGPYVIEDWRMGQGIRLKKNPNYFRATEGLPFYDQLEFRFVGKDVESNLDLIDSGECDFLDQEASLYLESISISDLIDLDKESKIDLHSSSSPVWEHLDFSLQHADYDDGYQAGIDRPDFFGDVRVRQAFALCIDWQRMADTIPDMQLAERPLSYVPSNHPLFNPETSQYEYDPQAAMALLDEVGWQDHDQDPATPRQAQNVNNVPDGTKFSVIYLTTTATLRMHVAEEITGSLASCGIQAIIESLPSSEFYADPPAGDLFSRRFDLAQFAWLTGENPPCDQFTSHEIPGDPEAVNPDGISSFPRGWQGQNNSGYHSPDFDQACWGAVEKLSGQIGYLENHHLAQEVFAGDIPVIPLFMRGKFNITRPDFCGHRMDSTARSDTWNIEEFDSGEDC